MIVFSTLMGTLAVAVLETTETSLRPTVAIELPASENRVQGNGQGEWQFNRDRSMAQLPVQTFAPLPKPRRTTFPTHSADIISPEICDTSTGKQPQSRPLSVLREQEVSQETPEAEICRSATSRSEISIEREITDNTGDRRQEFNSIPNVQAQVTAPQPAGVSPSLETQPSQPQQPPFQPQNLPVIPTESLVTPQQYRTSPSITIITPSGYGKSWGNLSAGLGLQARTRYTDRADGVLGFGFGLGDPRRSAGLDVGIIISDLDTLEDGTISLKLHRLLPHDLAVAVGVQNAIEWGFNDSGRSFYGVLTKRFNLQESAAQPFRQVYVSAGIGDGQFRSQSEIDRNINAVGFFGSIAVRVIEPVNAIAEWTGQDLTIGLSIIPLKNIPFVITPAITDIAGTAGDGSRLILGVGYLISF